MYGYNSTHASEKELILIAATYNSVAGSNDTNANAQGQNWQGSVNNNLGSYAAQLNTYKANHGNSLRFFAAAGNDLETNWGGPTPSVDWVKGFNSIDSAGIDMYDNGDWFGTCASSSCWTNAIDHEWSTSQKYFTNWGATWDFGYP